MATRTILPNDPSISFPDEKDFAFFSSENWARDCITLAKKTSIPPRSMVLLDCRARSMGQELPVGAAVLFTPAKEESSLHPYALEYSGNRFLIPYFNNSGDVREISRREVLGYFQEIDKNSLSQAFPLEEFWKEEDAILAA